ncbi:MAG: AzlD domain-containing protein, partial [Thermomicrobia bacterium]|nr:AzlD domain-containing protein [Thermomicrobia bacterium]
MWLTILGMSAVSYALRVVMLVTRWRFPAWLARGLAYVPIALFTALAVPGLLRP